MSDLLKKAKAKQSSKHITGQLKLSTKPDKKLMLIKDNKTIHFGLASSTTFLEGASKEKRSAYKARHSKIILKDGTKAISKKYSPAYLSYNLLW